MSNYNLQVSWSGKDALSDSDPDKVISGDDFNTEFSAVKTAVNSKADINGDASEAWSCNNLTAGGTATLTGNVTSNGDITAGNDGSGSLKWGTSGANTVGTNSTGAKTVSTSSPSGGSNGDVWYKVS